MQTDVVRIGTRGSALALAQAAETRARLMAAHGLPEEAFEIVVIRTTGDRIQDRPLSEAGGKGLFTREIEEALVEILSQPNAPLPTPGVVYRHLSKKMACCSCAPLAVSTIYALVEKLEREGRVSPDACATAKVRLVRLNKRRRELNLPRTALIAAE